MVSVNHIPETFTLPLRGQFFTNNKKDRSVPNASFTYMDTTVKSVTASEVPFEGEIVINKLTQDLITFEIIGKMGGSKDENHPENWKTFSASGILESPTIISNKIEKEKVLR